MAVELNSILLTVAPMAGASGDYLQDDEAFTYELINGINANLGKLNQLGIGVDGFHIEGSTETWDQFYGEDLPDYKKWIVREYMKMAIRKSFDPPTSGTLMQALNDQMSEYEFRLLVDQED